MPRAAHRLPERTAVSHKTSPSDSKAWIRANCSISSFRAGSQPFQPFEYQDRLFADDSRQRIVLKSRQMGVSRAAACEALYIALNRPGSTVLFVSRSLQAASNLARYAWQSIQLAVREGRVPVPSKRSRTEIEWGNLDSRIVSLAASPDSARSYAATAVYLDEAAHLPYAEDIYQSLAPTVSTGGRMTLISTPNGRGNLFHRLWEEADDDWSRHRIHWSERPEYTAEWAAREKKRHSKRSWAEEYELSFEESGNAVFPEDAIQSCIGAASQTPQAPFVAGLDLGRYGDYTVLLVLDASGAIVNLTRFQHASWTVQMDRVVTALKPYPGVRVLCDATGVGDPIIEALQHLATPADRGTPAPFTVTPFVYTAESRGPLIDSLVLAIEHKSVHIPPSETILLSEMRSFRWDVTPGGHARPGHPSGGHDDCIQALALACRLLQTPVKPRPPLVCNLVAVGYTTPMRWGPDGFTGGREIIKFRE